MFVIFSIDDQDTMWEYFEAWVAETFESPTCTKPLIGMYKGELEKSWIMTRQDFNKVIDAGWIDEQESILIVGESRDMAAALVMLDTGEVTQLGCMKVVSPAEAMKLDNWTLDTKTGKFFAV